ncbi:hypothetical protein M0811_14327 [Anaeramoeba ignava]|uniref:Uncharacterized protein n=1 Tax=Anaeramoeba ignava TaxID=1746090 RepID=A0A9Q0LVW2_ANAIG|nr:hypothetical protein M0811_14327 [Anaeramoeba ignava]
MNEIFFFGKNLFFVFIDEIPSIKEPFPFNFPNEKQIKQIIPKETSAIFLFENGEAIEYRDDANKYLKKIQFKNIKKIISGYQIEAILTEDGNLFAEGLMKTLLGIRNRNFSTKYPNISSLIEDPNDRIIEDIVCSSDTVYLLSSNQNCYGFGSNFHCQLGLDSETLKISEKPVLMMKNVSKVFSGISSNSVFILNSNQKLFGCGKNNNSQLGLGPNKRKDIHELTQVQSIPKGKIIDIQMSKGHSIMLIEDENEKRKIYSCGNYELNGFGRSINKFTELKSSFFEHGTKKKYFYQTKPIRIKLHKLTFNISDYHLSCGFQNSFIYYIPSPFSNLEEDLIKIFRRKEFCDISFKTINPNEKIEAHKLILKYRLKDQNQIEKLQEIISKIN